MTPTSKPRRKKAADVLDWRELAQGPALRGLAEVLGATPETTRAASRHLSNSYGVDTATEVDSPTVGESSLTPAADIFAELQLPDVTPTVGESILSPEEIEDTAVIPTVGETGSLWWDLDGVKYKAHRVRRVAIAQHSMGLGEERVYQTLWHAKESLVETKRTKTFSLGYDRIAKLVRLNEKSVRLLMPKLIRKKILEVVASEDSASRTGRTYRIFSYEEILERQRAASLQFVVKNGRAVEFVRTENEVDLPTVGVTPTVGESILSAPEENALDRQSSTLVREALGRYGAVDDEAVFRIVVECRKNASDATPEEMAYFIHDKGQIIRSGKIHNPIAFLLVYVPKCFSAEGLQAFRREQGRIREAEAARARELREWHDAEAAKQQAVLHDPDSSEEDKRWAQRFFEQVVSD